jgi:hypothetical protein
MREIPGVQNLSAERGSLLRGERYHLERDLRSDVEVFSEVDE